MLASCEPRWLSVPRKLECDCSKIAAELRRTWGVKGRDEEVHACGSVHRVEEALEAALGVVQRRAAHNKLRAPLLRHADRVQMSAGARQTC